MEKDQEAVLEIAKNMLSGLENIDGYKNSKLYAYMAYKELQEDFITGLRRNLLKTFRKEEDFGFMKDDLRRRELLSEDFRPVQ